MILAAVTGRLGKPAKITVIAKKVVGVAPGERPATRKTDRTLERSRSEC
jgi:hypothetical protein